MKPKPQEKPKGKLNQILDTINSLFFPTTKTINFKRKSNKPLAKDWLEEFDREDREQEDSDLKEIEEEFIE